MPRLTKIIASIGPSSDNAAVMHGLAEAGVNLFRFNMSHAQYDEVHARCAIVEQLKRDGFDIDIQADIQGLNIRTGNLGDHGVELNEGEVHWFVSAAGGGKEGDILVNDPEIHSRLQLGHSVVFMDGAIEGVVTEIEDTRFAVQTINSGMLLSRKSVNFPDTDLGTGVLTEKDRRDINFILNETNIPWLAVSFVGTGADVREVRDLCAGRPRTYLTSKIERKVALEHLNDIAAASDAIMVARGDLAVEVPFEQVPVLTRQMITLAHRHKKPVIVATQMLLSMAANVRPTRAEASDVAHAVFDRADAVMLSEETANGKNPVLAARAMAKIIDEAENYLYNRPNYFELIG